MQFTGLFLTIFSNVYSLLQGSNFVLGPTRPVGQVV